MPKQTTNHLLMIEPVSFGYNSETASNNTFQNNLPLLKAKAQENALVEFQNFVTILRENAIDVTVVKDTLSPKTPDSIFPNNWISFHANNNIGIYPMFAQNRREERREDILNILDDKGFIIDNITDYSSAEEEEIFLEGTGSMILDRVNEIAYLAVSSRSEEGLFIEFCEDFQYTPVVFHAYQDEQLIYHTNVMMSIADQYAVICLDSISDKKEKKNVIKSLQSTGKEIISISKEQLSNFAGNCLQVHNAKEDKFLVMSSRAYESLSPEQITQIEQYNAILHSPLHCIETLGGGSARCMIAEVFLSKE